MNEWRREKERGNKETRENNCFMREFIKTVSHVPTLWNNSDFVGRVVHTAVLYEYVI
jgi:hypothetical protein